MSAAKPVVESWIFFDPLFLSRHRLTTRQTDCEQKKDGKSELH